MLAGFWQIKLEDGQNLEDPVLRMIILKCFKNWTEERGLHLTFSECEQVADC
jgi:hypothetical protein